MKKIKLLFLICIFSFVFPLDIWVTIDKTQEASLKTFFSSILPQAKVKFFYWDTALKDINKLIKKNIKPDILLTGHTFVPSIANNFPEFDSIEPIFWDIRALYVWGEKPVSPVSSWTDMLYYLQTNGSFLSFPKQWSADSFYNFHAFFNDQLPFWVSQTPFSGLNMSYTLKLLTTLKKVYPHIFSDDPVKSFLNKEDEAIISGLWMYGLLKKQNEPFSVFTVPKSEKDIEFKGAYVGIYFNNDSTTQKAKDTINSYRFQKLSWSIFGLLPVNPKLQSELGEDPMMNVLIKNADTSKWASPVDPQELNQKISILNYFLKKKDITKNFNEKKYSNFFNNKIYYMLFKWFN